MSEILDPYKAYVKDAYEKVNELLSTYITNSPPRAFNYEDPKVFEAFWKGNYEGIDGYDKASPLSEPGNAHEMYGGEHQVNHPETEFIPHLFKFMGATTLAGLGHVTSVLRPGPLYVFNLYGEISDTRFQLPADATVVLNATRGLLLYQEQALTLLRMYWVATRREANELLILWAKGQEEAQQLKGTSFRGDEEAKVVFDYLKLHAGMPWPQSTAFNVAQYEYKQMFLKLYAPELFEQWKHWFYAKATSFAEANPSH